MTHLTWPNPATVEQKWLLVDATDKIVGRLASEIAVILMGKHRPTYTPHVDTGDFVVVINCEKVKFTGKKWDQKNTPGTPATPASGRSRPATGWPSGPS